MYFFKNIFYKINLNRIDLDKASVQKSNYVHKVRDIIAISLFHQGLLGEKFIKKFGYDINPPSQLVMAGNNILTVNESTDDHKL